jgi:hypothetical protein
MDRPRASGYDQYLHQHQQSSMGTTDGAYMGTTHQRCGKDVIPQKRWPYGPRRDREAPWAATTRKQGRRMSKPYKPQPRRAETRECYNCEKPEHLARTCKKPQRKEAAMRIRVCTTPWAGQPATTTCAGHIWAAKTPDGTYRYPRRDKRLRHDRSTKGLAILEKVEIKETDTRGTQVEEDYSDSTWIALDSKRPRGCHNWSHYDETWAPWESARKCRQLLEKQQEKLEKESMTLKATGRNEKKQKRA